MISLPLVKYVLQAASRDRLIISCIGLTVLGVCLAIFMGGSAVVEKRQFVMVFAAGGLRLLSISAITLFIAFFMQRSFAQRDVEFLLTRPLSRATFIVSHAIAFVAVAFLLAVIPTLAMLVLNGYSSGLSFLGLWGLSLFAEGVMMALVALFFSMVLPSATMTALMVIAFYVLARLVGQLIGIVDAGFVEWGQGPLSVITKLVSVFIPRFDLMTQTSWLVYGPQGQEGVLFILAQTLSFSFVVLTAAVIDLVRRQF